MQLNLGPEIDIGYFMKTNKQPNREKAARARYEIEFPLKENSI